MPRPDGDEPADRFSLDRPVRLVGVRFLNLVKPVEGTTRSGTGPVD